MRLHIFYEKSDVARIIELKRLKTFFEARLFPKNKIRFIEIEIFSTLTFGNRFSSYEITKFNCHSLHIRNFVKHIFTTLG